MPESEVKTGKLAKTLYAAGLALAGGVLGYLAADNFDELKLSWEDGLAATIAASLIASGIATLVIVLTRPSSVPKDCGVLQVIVLLLAGVMLAAPVAADHLFAPGRDPAAWLFSGIVALFGLQTIANVLLWMRSDELMRRVMADTSVWTFWPLQGALFLFAAAERLGLVQSISAWAMTGILMCVYLFASTYVAIRRGLT